MMRVEENVFRKRFRQKCPCPACFPLPRYRTAAGDGWGAYLQLHARHSGLSTCRGDPEVQLGGGRGFSAALLNHYRKKKQTTLLFEPL